MLVLGAELGDQKREEERAARWGDLVLNELKLPLALDLPL